MTSSTSALKVLAQFRLASSGRGVTLMIAKGSVVDFSSPKGAIVNAANEHCLGGGGVDGAISRAGGKTLLHDRFQLPILDKRMITRRRYGDDFDENDDSDDEVIEIRCPTGKAVVTGPGEYGSLQVPYVIHAVGPMYGMFANDDDSFQVPDQLLRSAYISSLECCLEHPIEDIAFSLLSAGIFRGERKLRDVLRIGIIGIRDFVSEKDGHDNDDAFSLKSISLVGFTAKEVDLLLDICREYLEEIIDESKQEVEEQLKEKVDEPKIGRSGDDEL